MGKKPFDIKVNWVADKLGRPSDEERRITGITSYWIKDRLLNTIDFKTTERYNYTFYDQAGDSYDCNVWSTWWGHGVVYYSKKPNIVRITGR
ncbi:MAG: hypothetical protein J3Q66DRAFT_337492 [Benniella sp.]|nr:MAG: hypothetical protein J3Q66DRAFT_337492 [Benniella sp.]